MISGPHDFIEGERLRKYRALWISGVNFDPAKFAMLVGQPDFPLMREGPTTPVSSARTRSGVQQLAVSSDESSHGAPTQTPGAMRSSAYDVALAASDGNIAEAARALGVTRQAVQGYLARKQGRR